MYEKTSCHQYLNLTSLWRHLLRPMVGLRSDKPITPGREARCVNEAGRWLSLKSWIWNWFSLSVKREGVAVMEGMLSSLLEYSSPTANLWKWGVFSDIVDVRGSTSWTQLFFLPKALLIWIHEQGWKTISIHSKNSSIINWYKRSLLTPKVCRCSLEVANLRSKRAPERAPES